MNTAPRHTASTITDDHLDALYAELDWLRAQQAPSARQEAAGGSQRAPGGSRAVGAAERSGERRTAAQAGACGEWGRLAAQLERARAELGDARATIGRYERDETARLQARLADAQQQEAAR